MSSIRRVTRTTIAVAALGLIWMAGEAASVDFDSSGAVDFDDFFLFADGFGLATGDPGYDAAFNLNGNNFVDLGDFFIFADNFGRPAGEIVIPDPPGSGSGPYASAGATFSLAGPSTINGVGPDQNIQIRIDADGLVGATQFLIALQFDPIEAFHPTNHTFTPGGNFSSAISPGVELLFQGFAASGAAILLGSPVDGASELGTFTLRTSASFDQDTEATVEVVFVSVGSSSTEQDGFGTDDFDLVVALNSEPVYPIAELSDADVAAIAFDGDLADWQSILGAPLIVGGELTSDPGVGDGPPFAAADLDYNIWLGWNQTTGRIYAAVERIDDVYINEYPGGNLGELWRYDSIEFRIDGDNSGGDYSPAADPSWTDSEQTLNNNRTAQQYGVIADAPDGGHIGYQGAGAWPNLPPYSDAGGASAGSAPTTSVAEFYVTPFDNLIWYDADASAPSQLYPDKIIGFDITLPDFDAEPGTYHAYHTLSGQASTWRYSERFADARLLSADPPPSELPPPRLRVNYPDGGEEVGGNGWLNIHWFAEPPIADVRIEYTVDGGSNWEEVVASTPNDGQFEWRVPEQFSTAAQIIVMDAADGNPADESDGFFSIVELLPKPVFDLPKFVHPPSLDGVRNPGEWAGALELEASVSQVLRDGEEFGWRDFDAQRSEISANQLVESDGEDPAIARTDADVSATIWHAWDDEAFYYIAEVRDNVHDVDSGPGQEPEFWWTRDGLSTARRE